MEEIKRELEIVNAQIAEATEEAKRMCEKWEKLQGLKGQATYLDSLYRRREAYMRRLGRATREDINPAYRSDWGREKYNDMA